MSIWSFQYSHGWALNFFLLLLILFSDPHSTPWVMDGNEKTDVLFGQCIRIGVPKTCLGTETTLIWRSKFSVCFVWFGSVFYYLIWRVWGGLRGIVWKDWLRCPNFWCLISSFQCIHVIYQTLKSLPSDYASSTIRLRLHVALRSSLSVLLDDVINFVDSIQEVLYFIISEIHNNEVKRNT